MSNPKTISVWVEDTPSDKLSALPARGTTQKVAKIAAEVLSTNLRQFLSEFQQTLDEPAESDFFVDQMELNLIVNATGGIELIGKLSTSVGASLKVTLKRRHA